MTEEVNGNAAPLPELPANPNIVQTQIQEVFKQHFTAVFNGIVLGNLQGVPAGIIASAAAVAMGRIISEYTHIPNDLQTMLMLRGKASELFRESTRLVGGLAKPGN